MQPCAHCLEAPRENDGLCRQCAQYPRCSGCGVIFGEGHSEPFFKDLCESCFDYESRIKPACIVCGGPKPTTIAYFRRNGNFCASCCAEAIKNAAHPTEFTVSEYDSIMRRFYPPEGESWPEASETGPSREDVSFVSGNGGQQAHKKMARLHKVGARERAGVHDLQSTEADEDPPEARVRRDGEEVFA